MEDEEPDAQIPKSRRTFTTAAYILFAAELAFSLYCLSALSVFLVVLIKGGHAFDFESPGDYPAMLQYFLVQAARKLKSACANGAAADAFRWAEWIVGHAQTYITRLENSEYLPRRGGWTSVMRCALLMWHVYWWVL